MNRTSTSLSVQKRVPFLELLRIIASFSVIVNHTVSDVFFMSTPSVRWFSSLFYFYASKIAVPVFLMISGYTLLDRQDDHKKSFLRFFRIGCSLVFFSAVYFIAYYLNNDFERFSIVSFVGWILPGPITNAYWYLYMYLGLLLMMPFLQRMVSALKKEDFHIFFLWSGFLYAFWPIVVHYIPKLTICPYFTAPLFFGEFCLLLLGCYLKRYCPASDKWRILSVVGFFACCALNVVLTYFEYQHSESDYLFFDSYLHLPIILESVCVFYFMSTLSFKEKSAKWIVSLGSLTFGIYLMSDLLNKHLKPVYLGLSQLTGMPGLSLIPYELLIFVLGGIIAFVLKKVPIVKKLL